MRKAYNEEIMNAENLAQADNRAKNDFKARNMPGYCKPGLYKPLVQDYIDYKKAVMQKIKDHKHNEPAEPYYATMPERFQNYEKMKIAKMESRKMKQGVPYHMPKVSLEYGVDFKKYFEEQQKAFQDQLNIRKAKINKQLNSESQKPQSFVFTSQLNRDKKKHVCASHHHTNEPCEQAKKPKKQQIDNSKAQKTAIEYNTRDYDPGYYLSYKPTPPSKYVEREFVMDENGAVLYEYTRKNPANTLNHMVTENSRVVEEKKFARKSKGLIHN